MDMSTFEMCRCGSTGLTYIIKATWIRIRVILKKVASHGCVLDRLILRLVPMTHDWWCKAEQRME